MWMDVHSWDLEEDQFVFFVWEGQGAECWVMSLMFDADVYRMEWEQRRYEEYVGWQRGPQGRPFGMGGPMVSRT